MSSCANCGKGEDASVALKNCVACKMVQYCSRDCQKAHCPQHKKECRKRAAELHEEALFKQPPPREECPICFMRMPSMETGWIYNTCCGKIVCSGCLYAGAKMEGNVDELCPFCRAPAPETGDEIVEREKKRVEVGDAQAMYGLGCDYAEGMYSVPQDRNKALELWHRAGELGCAEAFNSIGYAYLHGHGVERDEKKAVRYWELASIGGVAFARHNLGTTEIRSGNYDRALKHFLIAVGAGDHDSLKMIQQMYSNRHATRDDYSNALKDYQAYLDEIKSEDRDTAAAFSDRFKYYE